jgi:hypothetical protein
VEAVFWLRVEKSRETSRSLRQQQWEFWGSSPGANRKIRARAKYFNDGSFQKPSSPQRFCKILNVL